MITLQLENVEGLLNPNAITDRALNLGVSFYSVGLFMASKLQPSSKLSLSFVIKSPANNLFTPLLVGL